jgi:acyl-CoA synthetase (AMP-forming)/AMP-acid ligase II
MDVQIVNPDTLEVCPDGSVGEVWVKGDNIALGYWKRPEQTEETFAARISGTGEGPFMRTGDLGFFYKDELFVTGRIKDLIIIDGSNHYPQDIEWSITDSHPAIKPHGAAAFAVETGSGEKLVVVAEIDRRVMRDMPDVTPEQVAKTIRSAVSNFHDLRIHDLVLTTRRIPKTTSGKIQHHHCKQQYLDGQFQEEDSSQ